jgi:hypothetical protein
MKKLLLGAALSFAACIPPGCIARGARVRTPRGSRPIEDLEVGDEVLCVDPELDVTHVTRITWRRVVQRECLTLSFDGGALQCTSDHPLYCPTSKGWHPAGDWALGKRTSLLQVTAEGQRVVEVTSVSTFSGVHDVFDLTVEHPLHNFVADGVLVHNKTNRQPPCADGGVPRESCQCPSSPGIHHLRHPHQRRSVLRLRRSMHRQRGVHLRQRPAGAHGLQPRHGEQDV